MKYNFLKTSDEETKEKLLKEGFKLVSQDGNVFTFLNDHILTFEDKSKIQYSNTLCIQSLLSEWLFKFKGKEDKNAKEEYESYN